ncbi:hypothetical protein SISSUDRAFT_370114 [Sistotremastrum suecicum HHB10207 ss-3]|uniref:Glycerophosphocholine acyltransferase 1 n=1 Tax=Sistotremastrum suecicum HHB10207 ss-3 TaxID=1314776 RepID=A0A166FYR6_9AGAM|nr:hypothetical protein SISSUDRAFT_370114 [Sistotremastrum suecicum HHB10207 ss-3]
MDKRLKKHGDRIKKRTEEALKRTKTPLPGEMLDMFTLDKEVQKFRLRVSSRMTSLAATWHSTKVVRTREKLSFFFGVMNVLISALMLGMSPQWIHIAYTAQACVLLPVRIYTYKKKQWHYFLFDLCYFCQILFLAFLWFMPWSPIMLMSSYCLAHGSLASAVITWRNSLVFHDADKITSLFIHVSCSLRYPCEVDFHHTVRLFDRYPPFVFTVIRHFYPDAELRFPALAKVPYMPPGKALLVSGLIYLVWQGLYWKFVMEARRKKIESGQRTTSFSYLLNDKRGVIGRMLGAVKPVWREPFFMFGQFVYALVTEIPAVFLLYDSKFWSGAFLLLIFGVSVWNGGGFYIEVFGRKFERELEALRKELAEATARSEGSSNSGRTSPVPSDDEGASSHDSPLMMSKPLPAIQITEPGLAADIHESEEDKKTI